MTRLRGWFKGDFNRELAAWGVLLELALLAFWAISGVWRGSPLLIYAFFLPGTVFILVVWRVLHRKLTPITRMTPAILIGFAALFHITLLLTPSPLSNDLYRYWWDGKLLAHGLNPYTFAPSADELESFRDATWALIFNRDVPTGYPPLAEALFAGAYRLYSHPWVLRGFATFASLGAAWLLIQALGAAGGDQRRAIIYAWSPLVALEFSNSGHLDSYALLFLCAALVLHIRRRPIGTAICLALGGLFKFFPALLAPYWGRRWGKTAWLAFLLVFGLPWLPFLIGGTPFGGTPFRGLSIFAIRGDFNGSLYRLLESTWFLILDSAYARIFARLTVVLLVGLFYLLGIANWRRGSEPLDDWRFSGTFFGITLLLSPVAHPWYLCWMLAFISVDGPLAWLVPSLTCIFARHVYLGYEQTGEWQEAWWPSLAVWVPFFLAYTLEWLSSHSRLFIKSASPHTLGPNNITR